jgi:hypothetical protein
MVKVEINRLDTSQGQDQNLFNHSSDQDVFDYGA